MGIRPLNWRASGGPKYQAQAARASDDISPASLRRINMAISQLEIYADGLV